MSAPGTLSLKLQENEEEEVPQEWVGVRCLMVDDDRLICENAAELLEDMGLRTEMPRMDGYEDTKNPQDGPEGCERNVYYSHDCQRIC